MQRDSAIIAIINMVGIKNLGIAHMKNCMLLECAKTVISITTIKRRGKGIWLINYRIQEDGGEAAE